MYGWSLKSASVIGILSVCLHFKLQNGRAETELFAFEEGVAIETFSTTFYEP